MHLKSALLNLFARHAWLVYACLAAISASLINVFAKVGMEGINSNLATAIRSIVMTIFLVLVCTSLGVWDKLPTVHSKALVMIILSGVAGALSWLFVFRAIQLSEVSRVAPIDKLSMPLGIVLAVLLLGERPTILNWIGIAAIAIGAYLATWR
jgi:transporter family protein